MSIERGLAILLIAMGSFVLLYDGIWITSAVAQAELAVTHKSVHEAPQLRLPAWFGVSTVALGGLLLLVTRPRGVLREPD